MLDTDTKRRIDIARDILVGKVPDPKSQVEQITIAFIYKFMDDMDAESEEMGGKRKFFARDFSRYGWAKLMRSGLGGHETLNLYAEAITRMPENPGIPPLFREIFKNAYLPYRDPETLRAFLKIIDEFTNDHSERLGDAFEYLLSVLGSQGDAGQFRTPRHIIDFIVEVIDPKKAETVLDPACGTAGFLISSYKHILKANTNAKGHSTLTSDDKGRMAKNFKGYDISPDMVRLSLVNLYKNDLPAAADFLKSWLDSLRSGTSAESTRSTLSTPSTPNALIVEKEKIAANGEYNLSGERYGEQTRLLRAKWPTVALCEICTFMTGGTPTSTVAEYYENGTVPWLVSGDIHRFEIWDCEKRITSKAVENSNARVLPKDSVLIALNGQGKTRGTVALLRMDNATCNQSLVAITPAKPSRTISEFIFWTLRSMYSDIRALTGDAERSGLNIPILKRIQIPLPPLEVQKEIVAEIEGYQKVIDGARAVLDNYRPHIPIHPDWLMVELGELCEKIQYGLSVPLNIKSSGFKIFRMNELVEGKCVDHGEMKYARIPANEFAKYKLIRGDILFNRTNSFEHVGRTGIFDLEGDYCFASYLIRLAISDKKANPHFVNAFMNSDSFQQGIKQFASRAIGQSNINAKSLDSYPIPLPPLSTQKAIVAEIKAEQALVAANRELITRFEKKIRSTLARVWGEDSNPIKAKAREALNLEGL